MNAKIGTIQPDGSVVWPSETLAGAPFERGDFDKPPAIQHTLDAVGHFCIGDVWPPRGFDVNAALDALKAELTPAPSSKKAEKADAEAKP